MGDQNLQNLKNQYNDLTTRVTKVEKSAGSIDRTLQALAINTEKIATTMGFHTKIFVVAVAIVTAWLTALTGYGIGLIKDVAALQGKGGSYEATLKSIKNSTEPREVSANLTLLSGQIQKQAVSKTPPTEAELIQIGAVVSDATKKYPELPAAWETSGKLISYRFEAKAQASTSARNCLGRSLPEFQPTVPDPDAYLQYFEDCTLVIDDQQAYKDDPGVKKFIAERSIHPTVTSIELHLLRVHVVYRGGALIPVTDFIFSNCTFEFDLPMSAPPEAGKHLIRQLLTANSTQPVAVTVAPPT